MIYVTSDLHGYSFNDFTSNLSSVGFSSNDWLYILGDVIDYGKDGVKYLNWLLEQGNVQLILGNHEAMLLGCSFVFDIMDNYNEKPDEQNMKKLTVWMKNGGEGTLAELKKLSAENPEQLGFILEYLREECPLYETVSTDSGEFLLTHSGLGNFEPGKKLSDYTKKELMWHTAEPSDKYFDGIVTVFGHTPTYKFGDRFSGKCVKTKTWIDIDTGCDAGNAPMLLRLDDMKEFYF